MANRTAVLWKAKCYSKLTRNGLIYSMPSTSTLHNELLSIKEIM